jgi:hypothetical protein
MPYQYLPMGHTLRVFLAVWLFGTGVYVMNSFTNRTSVTFGNWRKQWSRCDCSGVNCTNAADSGTHESFHENKCNCNHSNFESLKSSIDSSRVLSQSLPENSTDPYYFPDWRVKFASTPPPWSYHTIVSERRNSSDPNAPCEATQHNIKWTGDRWDELVPDAGACCARCRKRHSCVAFSFVSDTCLLFTRVTGNVHDPGCISAFLDAYPAPPDCRTLGTPCDCPPSTWAATNPDDLPDRAAACELLAGRQLFAAGDSLVRDTWTSLVLWLIVADGVDVVLRAGTNHHAACMPCAWKMLILLGVKRDMQARGLLVEGPQETIRVSACGGRASLAFIPAPLFSDLERVKRTVTESAHGGVADLLLIGAGVHEMVKAGGDEAPVRAWARLVTEAAASAADNAAAAPRPVARGAVVIGTHARIAALAPPQYRDYAEGPQGNVPIRAWNAATAQEVSAAAAAGRPAAFVDPYRLTAELVRYKIACLFPFFPGRYGLFEPCLFHFFGCLWGLRLLAMGPWRALSVGGERAAC